MSERSFSLCKLRSQKQGKIPILTQRNTPQREFQRGDNPHQEAYLILGFELASMAPAKKHIPELGLPCTLAISTF